MWTIKEKEIIYLLVLWPNLISYSKLYECIVPVLLLTSTPLAYTQGPFAILCLYIVLWSMMNPRSVMFLVRILNFPERIAIFASKKDVCTCQQYTAFFRLLNSKYRLNLTFQYFVHFSWKTASKAQYFDQLDP